MSPNVSAAAPLAGDAAAEISRRQAAAPPRMPAVPDSVEAVVSRDLLAAVDKRLAVVVVFAVDDEREVHTRSRVYLTLTAAQRAVEEARGRGQHAAAALVELHVLGVLEEEASS